MSKPVARQERGRVNISIADNILTATRTYLAARGDLDISTLCESLLRDWLKKEGVPSDLSSDDIVRALKGAKAAPRKSATL